jgi:hypothetical protein
MVCFSHIIVNAPHNVITSNNNNNQELITFAILYLEKEQTADSASTATAVGNPAIIRNSELLRTYEVFIRTSDKSLTYKFLR